MKKHLGNRSMKRDEFEVMHQTPSEYLVALKAYKDMITMESSGCPTPTGQQSKYDVLRRMIVPTKTVNDVMRSFEVSKQSGQLKRLERTSNTNCHPTGQTMRIITQSEAIEEALSLTRKELPGMNKSEVSTVPLVSQSENGSDPGQRNNKVPPSNLGQCSGVSAGVKSRGRTKIKKYRTKHVGKTKREGIVEIRVSPPPQIDLNIPQIRRIMDARRRAHTRQLLVTAKQKCQSPKSETVETLPPPSKTFHEFLVQKNAPHQESRPPWNASCAPIRPPRPVLLQPYFKSLLLCAGFKFAGVPVNPPLHQYNPPNGGPNNSGDSSPKSWEYPRNITNSYGESTFNSYNSNTSQQNPVLQTSYPLVHRFLGSMEHERRILQFPQYNFPEEYEDETQQKSPIWPGGFVDKFGGKVPATIRLPQAKPKNEFGEKAYRSKQPTHRLIPVKGIKFDRPEQIPQTTIQYHKSRGMNSKSRHYPSSTHSATKQNVPNVSINFRMIKSKRSNKVLQVNGIFPKMQPEEVTYNPEYPAKTSLTKRISQTVISGSKLSLEKIEDPRPTQSPPPLSRPRRRRIVAKEPIENSERIQGGLESKTIQEPCSQRPTSQRPTTGKMVDRVEESLDLTQNYSNLVLREGDSDVETIYVAPMTEAFNTLFTNHYLSEQDIKNKNPIPVKMSTHKSRKGLAHKLWEGIKRVGSKESRVYPVK